HASCESMEQAHPRVGLMLRKRPAKLAKHQFDARRTDRGKYRHWYEHERKSRKPLFEASASSKTAYPLLKSRRNVQKCGFKSLRLLVAIYSNPNTSKRFNCPQGHTG